uniref:G-protein coupled receptors family 1 profile domain-containing protein n=1 Tax=Arion vulgaris TaxID=1028688 RepID=A0A0B6ZR42_9EUPU
MMADSKTYIQDSDSTSKFSDLHGETTDDYFEGVSEVSDEIMSILHLVNTWGVGQCVTVLGIITNIINIIVFVKQGVKDTVNISLLGLAISDLVSLLFLHLLNLCFTPSILSMDLPFYPDQIMWHWGWAHTIFTRIGTGITAWITLERCLCIAAPLKVKIWITPKRSVMFMVILYIVMIGHVLPVFYTSQLTLIFDFTRNKTILGMHFMENRNDIEEVVFLINNILPSTFFVLIIVCTTILVRELRKKSKWRKQTSTSIKDNVISDRDTKIIKMVVLISAVFIFCYSPGVFVHIWAVADTELRPDGKNWYLMYAYSSFMLHFEAINSSVNLFIYLSTSSKFQTTFYHIFCCYNRKSNGKDTKNL